MYIVVYIIIIALMNQDLAFLSSLGALCAATQAQLPRLCVVFIGALVFWYGCDLSLLLLSLGP